MPTTHPAQPPVVPALTKFHLVTDVPSTGAASGQVLYSDALLDSDGRQFIVGNVRQFMFLDRSEIHGLQEALTTAAAQYDAVAGAHEGEVAPTLDGSFARDVITRHATEHDDAVTARVEYTSTSTPNDLGAGRVDLYHSYSRERLTGIRPAELPAMISLLTDAARRLGVIA